MSCGQEVKGVLTVGERTVIVYSSRNGSTRHYAEWLAQDCGAKLLPWREVVVDELAKYETVVFGGCVYNGLIDGISLIKNNRDVLRGCRLFVFTVGLTQPGDETAFKQVLDRNFEPDELEGIQFHHFLGALDFKKMSLMQRMMMRLLKKSIQKKPEENRSVLESSILEAYGGQVDFTNRKYIKPMVKAILTGSES